MNKTDFFNELKDILELENDISEDTEIHLTSLSTLSVMALVYENFEKQVKPIDLQKTNNVKDLLNLIGIEHFS